MIAQKSTETISGSVMIVGAGIGGMQAALDLASGGFKVHMIQKDSSIGGTMVMLDKTFPTGDCSMCMISPRMVEITRHPNIELHTMAEVTKVSGEAGNFSVTVKQQPRYVDPVKCTGCGLCEEKCPKKVDCEFNQNLSVRKAIYSLFPQAVPNTRLIDRDNCIYFIKGRCRACEKVCPSDAILFDDAVKNINLNVGSIILAPGLKRFDPYYHQELGYGRWQNVVTSVQFERILSASGPYEGELKRPHDGQHPAKVAWIQCIGSRNPHNANSWCSSVCCMYATKQAVIAKEHDSNVEPTIFYMEMRTFGKDFDRYVSRAKNDYGVRYIRSMVSDVREDPLTKDLALRYTTRDGAIITEHFNLVVLSVGFEPHLDSTSFSSIFSIDQNFLNFAYTNHFTPVETSRKGIFVSGTFQGPKDIPETVIQGSAVASSSMALLSEARGTEIEKVELPDEIDVNSDDARIGVIICHCGINIAQTVDVKRIADEISTEPDVAHSSTMLYACSQDGQQQIKDLISKENLNRILVASCTPRTHEPLFQDTIREAGLNRYLFELADIREQCSWCHMGDNNNATRKALSIVKMSLAKVRRLSPVPASSADVIPGALIIGGGIAGMTSALSLADQGFKVDLVEKKNSLGGLAAKFHKTINGEDIRGLIDSNINRIVKHKNITLHTDTEVKSYDGYVGNFTTILTNGREISHGAVIVSTGGSLYNPKPELFPDYESILTQSELENKMAEGKIYTNKRFIMLQCVGSREEPFNYCSRVCCQDAVKNAIALKEKSPNSLVVIFYRDIRTYGLTEVYYRKARDLGVIFVQFEVDKKPEISYFNHEIKVSSFDTTLQAYVNYTADHLILSTGLRANGSAEKIGQLYKLTRNQDGFFLEAHVKLRPVDFPCEGIYLAGLAHAPKTLDETISQAIAAAGRAGILLSKDTLPVSGIISKHNRENCMSCLACLRFCPFGSPFLDSDGKISHNEVKCTGCGICAGICPARAYQVNTFRDDQIVAMIDSVTSDLQPQKEY